MSTGPRHRRKPLSATSQPAYGYSYEPVPSGFTGDAVTVTSSASSSSLTDLDMSFSFRDRTNEFNSAVDSLRGRSGSAIVGRSRTPGAGMSASASSGKLSALQVRSKFTQASRQINSDLGKTCVKLEKLAMLAKKQSLFDDRGSEIQQLTYIIKQDLAALNKQISELQELARSQGGSRQRTSHSNAVVVSLQSKLASASNEFKNVLEVRTESLKKQAARREHFTTANGTPAGGATSGHKDRASSILLQDDLVAQQRYAASNGVGSDVAITIGEEDEANAGGARYQHQMLLIDEQDKFHQERADTMKNIEQTIVELGDIFHQLAFMVKEQEEVVARIDSNVDDASLNVDMAHSELLKYFKSISSNRWLMIKVFGVLIVFFIIFVVFVA